MTLTMIGPDRQDGSLARTKRLAEELGIAHLVSFPGAVPKTAVPTWLDRADLFINTTDIDNTPISVEEAMACGLCIVSTNVGGLPHLLQDGVDSLLVNPRDPRGMAGAIRMVLTDARLAQRLSSTARMNAERLDWSRAIPRWIDLLEAIVPNRLTTRRSFR
jgi:glycosyltransferase involved in cell wall biosynthesis